MSELVGPRGFEPRLSAPKALVLPLHYGPINLAGQEAGVLPLYYTPKFNWIKSTRLSRVKWRGRNAALRRCRKATLRDATITPRPILSKTNLILLYKDFSFNP